MLGELGNSTGGAVSLEDASSFISCPWTVTKNIASNTGAEGDGVRNFTICLYAKAPNSGVALWSVGLVYDTVDRLSESTDQQWHHYCLVSAGRSDGNALLYLDGVYRGTDFKRIEQIKQIKHEVFEIGRYWPKGLRKRPSYLGGQV